VPVRSLAAPPPAPAGDEEPPIVFAGDRDYRPLSFLDRGAPRGLDVEVAEALAGVLGRKVRVELTDWDQAQEKVQTGAADVLLGMSVTEERRASYDFSLAAFEHEFGLFVREGDLRIGGPEDLAGRTVGVAQAGYPRRLLSGRPDVNLVPVQSYRDGFNLLAAGRIDAFAADVWVGSYEIQRDRLSGIALAGAPFARQRYGMAVRKGNLALRDEVNRGLETLERDGTLGRIRERWRPQQMVFATRERVRDAVLLAVGIVLVLLLASMAIWVTVLKRHIRIQRRTEAALRESEERLRVAFATFPDAIVMTRPDGSVASVNEGFTRLSGWSEAEVLGKTMADFGIWVDDGEQARFLEAVRGGRVVQNLEATFRRKDGRLATGLVSAASVVVKGQRVLLGVTRDITDRKEAEAQREEALRQLELLKARLEEENLYLKEEITADLGFTGIIGESDPLRYVFMRVRQVAGSDASVLVQGETGVGKELVARAIHEASRRAGAAFVRVNCAALPPTLAESELFGHEAGAFTGAARMRKGRFELADGGTLFLDEIGELSLELQAKLLRVLQEGEFERLGSSRTLRTDVRVIAATNRSLKAEVAAGRFREDLFYRLNVFPITVPALRDRREDIPLLVQHFVRQLAERTGKTCREVPPAVMRALTRYSWPGNVRELRNVLERAVLQTTDGVLRLPEPLEVEPERASAAGSESATETLEEVERRHILATLELTRGRVSGAGGAAELLGLNPNTLRSRMKKLGVEARREVAVRAPPTGTH
jgi:PAS domain S-box-containing protein